MQEIFHDFTVLYASGECKTEVFFYFFRIERRIRFDSRSSLKNHLKKWFPLGSDEGKTSRRASVLASRFVRLYGGEANEVFSKSCANRAVQTAGGEAGLGTDDLRAVSSAGRARPVLLSSERVGQRVSRRRRIHKESARVPT